MKRREAIQLITIGGAVRLGAQQHVGHAPAAAVLESESKLTFFTPEQNLLVDELTEMILPTDDHSPGARAAKVSLFIDGKLSDASDDEKRLWKRGLEAVDTEANKRFGKTFHDSTPAQRDAILADMAAGEKKPSTDLHRFFVRLKTQTISGYYTSSIGLLKDLEYKGVVPQAKYQPCEHPEHQPPAEKKQ